MRKLFWLLLVSLFCYTNAYAYSGIVHSASEGLTGTDGDSLDEISVTNSDGRGHNLTHGDVALVTSPSEQIFYVYTFNGTSTASESSPDVIVPNNSGGTGRWELSAFYSSIVIEEDTHATEHENGGSDEIAITADLMNGGSGATSSTFWRGDNTWAAPDQLIGVNSETLINTPDGTWTFTGVGGSNNEVLTIDLETLLNTITFGSTSDVDTFVFEGTIDVDNIQFDITPAAHSHEEGSIHWSEDDKTVQVDTEVLGVAYQVGQENMIRVTNKTGAQLDNGTCVYVNGAQGNRPTVAKCDADGESTSHGIIAVMTHDLADNGTGYATVFGLVRDLDTSSWAEGTALYMSSTAGELTSTKPVAPAHVTYIGSVTTQNASTGVIFVRPQIGFEVDELHDVLISSLTDNDILIYDSVSGLWKNEANSTIAHASTHSDGGSDEINVEDLTTTCGDGLNITTTYTAGVLDCGGIEDYTTVRSFYVDDSFILLGNESTPTNPFYIAMMSGDQGYLNISGSDCNLCGANISLYGAAHTSQAEDIMLQNDSTWIDHWDNSLGKRFFKSGTIETLHLTLEGNSGSELATFAGGVTVSGAFTSPGIDDNADATAMTIDSNERILMGHTSSMTIGGAHVKQQIAGTAWNDSSLYMSDFMNNAGSTPNLIFGKSRSGTIGTYTTVQDDDLLGAFWFQAADGTDMETAAAAIKVFVDGTPASNNVPGRIGLYTATGGASPTLGFVLNSNKTIGMPGYTSCEYIYTDASGNLTCATSLCPNETEKTSTAEYTIGTTDSCESDGGQIYTTTAVHDLNLPEVATGMNFCVTTNSAHVISLAPNQTATADTITLDGTALTAGYEVDSGGAAGEQICCSYYSANNWNCVSDGWSNGGAND